MIDVDICWYMLIFHTISSIDCPSYCKTFPCSSHIAIRPRFLPPRSAKFLGFPWQAGKLYVGAINSFQKTHIFSESGRIFETDRLRVKTWRNADFKSVFCGCFGALKNAKTWVRIQNQRCRYEIIIRYRWIVTNVLHFFLGEHYKLLGFGAR